LNVNVNKKKSKEKEKSGNHRLGFGSPYSLIYRQQLKDDIDERKKITGRKEEKNEGRTTKGIRYNKFQH
jgi:hypothetical protein